MVTKKLPIDAPTSSLPICPGDTLTIGLHIRTIEASESICSDTEKLHNKPLNEGRWIRCLVSAEQFESETSNWAQVKGLPGIHKAGKTPNDKYYEVSVRQSWLQWLLDNNVSFELWSEKGGDFQQDVLEPIDGETQVYGRGLDWRRTGLQHVLASTEWAMVISDIVKSDREVLDQFLLYCVLLGMQLGVNLVQRDRDVWIQHFLDLGSKKTKQPVVDVDAEMHDVSLLRALLESAGGEMDAHQHTFDYRLSSNENLMRLVYLLDLRSDEGPSPGNFDEQDMKEALVRSEIFGAKEVDITTAKKNILRYVPIAFPGKLSKTSPEHLIYDIGYGTRQNIETQMASICDQVCCRATPESQNLLFLCCCASVQRLEPALYQWAISLDGNEFYQQTVAGLQEAQTAGEIILRVLALLWFVRLLPDAPDEVSEPIHGSYISEFSQLADGQRIKSRLAVLERMTLSIRRVVGEGYPSSGLHFLDSAVAPKPPSESDKLADYYWNCRLYDEMSHTSAWDSMWLGEMLTRVGGANGTRSVNFYGMSPCQQCNSRVKVLQLIANQDGVRFCCRGAQPEVICLLRMINQPYTKAGTSCFQAFLALCSRKSVEELQKAQEKVIDLRSQNIAISLELLFLLLLSREHDPSTILEMGRSGIFKEPIENLAKTLHSQEDNILLALLATLVEWAVPRSENRFEALCQRLGGGGQVSPDDDVALFVRLHERLMKGKLERSPDPINDYIKEIMNLEV